MSEREYFNGEREIMKYEISLDYNHEIRSNNLLCCGETGRVMAVFYNNYDLEELMSQVVERVSKHDGARFESAKSLIAKMNKSDLRLMTDFCLELERKL